ncbi:MAG: ABC transporter permease [Lachnospiraceae bacterium]|nr:ABC transporter permease [Lachnospiraceae bacterium]
MFFKLISRNSKRNRKENGLFFSSLLVSIIAFYIILSLPKQDVMIFLTRMESYAVNKLMMMIPAFFGMTLFILFFLIYYASKFQLERRRHELGVYLMMGMRRIKLLAMLLAEDLRNSVVSLLIGLPIAVLLSELISLITTRLVGLGIVGHQFSFSLNAVLWTAVGFLLIKFVAFFILSVRISRQEIGSLIVDTPDGAKKQLPVVFYALSLLAGIVCLVMAYAMAIHGEAWRGLRMMGLTLFLGVLGTLALFWGLRLPIGFAAKTGKTDRQLHVFNLRQIQETVIHRSGMLAICSLLILAALCCFGAGVGIFRFYGDSTHILDYTFECSENYTDTAAIRQTLADYRLDTRFSDLFEMKVGHIRTTEDHDNAFQMETVMSALRELEPSMEREILLNNLSYATYPYLISLGDYNKLLTIAGLPVLTLDADEAAVYIDSEFTTNDNRTKLLNGILAARPETRLGGDTLYLTGTVQTTDIVTDRSITLSFALILPDEAFEYYTQGDYSVYLNGVLAKGATENASLMSAISDINDQLNGTGLHYESYLQNMGRQLFYMVSASYITIYLAIIFLIIANTVIGVQFLIGQQKSSRRYRTLIHLGATHTTLCQSSRKQINWYFGVPVVVAVFSSLFGVRALFTGILSSSAKNNLSEMMIISVAMILVLCVVEYIYVAVVKRSSDHYLLTLMVPEREE